MQTDLTECHFLLYSSINMSVKSVTVQTQVFEGQKPGTSGLRKAVKVYQQDNYTENFVQCTVSAALDSILQKKEPCSLVIGGDGRYYEKEATHKIIQICAANGVSVYIVLICICNHGPRPRETAGTFTFWSAVPC